MKEGPHCLPASRASILHSDAHTARKRWSPEQPDHRQGHRLPGAGQAAVQTQPWPEKGSSQGPCSHHLPRKCVICMSQPPETCHHNSSPKSQTIKLLRFPGKERVPHHDERQRDSPRWLPAVSCHRSASWPQSMNAADSFSKDPLVCTPLQGPLSLPAIRGF